MGAPSQILELVERFERNREAYLAGRYNETQLRREFIDPMFAALGWDVNNEQGSVCGLRPAINRRSHGSSTSLIPSTSSGGMRLPRSFRGRRYSRGSAGFAAGEIRHYSVKQTTEQMKQQLDIPQGRPLADFLPTITIKAKDFANEITNFNIKRDNLKTEAGITKEHVKNNKDVRELLVKRNIRPEALPPEEEIKKLERKLTSEEKKWH